MENKTLEELTLEELYDEANRHHTGFALKSLSEMRRDFSEDDIRDFLTKKIIQYEIDATSEYIEKLFSLEDMIDKVPGVSNNMYWNGWAMPYFTYDVIIDIICPVIDDLTYDPERDLFVMDYNDPDMEVDEFESTIINGKKYYGIGRASWIWTEVEV